LSPVLVEVHLLAIVEIDVNRSQKEGEEGEEKKVKEKEEE
jgi:hypothetical protein